MAYNLQNFVADCGGLLGLFMGISFLSIVDAILRCIVRIMSRKKEINQVDVEGECDEKLLDHKSLPYESMPYASE